MTITQIWQSRHRHTTPFAAAFLAFLSLTLGAGSTCNPVPATPGQSVAPAGYVYVNNNTPGMNSVTAFARGADGSLTPLSGSPFATGCCGTGSGVGSQDGLVLSSDGRFLLAANPGGDSIAVLSIGASGAPEPVSGSPFPSGGKKPVSIAVHNQLVFVANAGDGGSNYAGFTLAANGSLGPIDGSISPSPTVLRSAKSCLALTAPDWSE